MATINSEDKKAITINIDRSKYDALEAYFAMQNHTLGDFLLQDIDRKYGMVKSFAEKYFGGTVLSVPKSIPKRRPLPKKSTSSDKSAGSNSQQNGSDDTEKAVTTEGGEDDAEPDGG